MDLVKLHSNLKQLDVVDLAYRVIDDMSEFITDLNKKRLSEKGEDSEGSNIGDYSEVTVNLKDLFGKGIGSITDHVTGFSTGESYRSMFSGVIGDKLVVDTTTPQWSLFEDHFDNKNILGLTDNELKLVIVEFNKRFWPRFENAIWK